MTNFFDIATPEEVQDTLGYIPEGEELTLERESFELDADHNCVSLYLLFLERGEAEKAVSYYEQIQSPERQLEAAMLAGECVEA